MILPKKQLFGVLRRCCLCTFHLCRYVVRIKHNNTGVFAMATRKKKKSSAKSGSTLLFVNFASPSQRYQDHSLPFLPGDNSLSQMQLRGGSALHRGRHPAVLLGIAALALRRAGVLFICLPSDLVWFFLQMDFNCKRHHIEVVVV